jgi:predicted MFS family arabinose efflux permease
VRRERLLLWLLAGLQFTHILDFMMISPLSPQFMRLWGISAQEFGYLVSVYAIAAAVAGLAAAFVIDRYDRRAALMAMYAGFVLATLACALAPGYWSFFAARAMAGAFGGVIGSVVMAIIGDVIPAERRGRAMGTVMSAFPVVSVLGVPIGLYLATRLGWHAPFFMLAAVSAALWLCLPALVPRVAAHMQHPSHRAEGMLRSFLQLFTVRTHRRALGAIFVFTLSGFMLFPFLSAYQVLNVGITEAQLVYVFLFSGLATLFTSRLIGWCADHYGKRRTFYLLALASIVPIVLITNLPRSSLPVLLAVTVPFMVLMSGRFIPLMALITTAVHAPVRGAFMSLSSAVQNLGSGVASLFAGAVLGHAADGSMTRFDLVGACAVVLTLACVALVRGLHPALPPGGPPVQ